MTEFGRWAGKHPLAIVAVVAAMTLVFAFGIPKIKVETDIRQFFPKGDPAVETYRKVSEKFGGMEYIMVGVVADDVFKPETLDRIDRLSRAIAEVPGVKSVRSITNIEEIRSTDGLIEVAPLVRELPRTARDAETLRRRALSDDFYVGNFVSRSGRMALIMVQVAPDAEPVTVSRAIRQVVSGFQGPERIVLTGTPPLNELLTDAIRKDLIRLFPLSVLLVSLVLYLAFRNWRGVALPLLTVLLSVVWTMGLMGYTGAAFSQVAAMMPVLLVSVGSAYGIHVLARFEEERTLGLGREQALARTVGSVGLAVFLAAITTVVGFAANGFTKIIRLREFGFIMAFGVFAAFIISVVFIPAVLRLLPDRPPKARAKGTNRLIQAFLARVAYLVTSRKRLVTLAALLLLVLIGLGLPRLTTDSDFLNFFKPGSEPRQAAAMVTREFGGTQTIEIVVQGDLQDPQVLRQMELFQEDLRKVKVLSKPLSLVDILKRTNQVMHDGDPAYDRLPESREAVAQYLLLLSMSDTGLLEQLITEDYQEGKIQVRVAGTDSVVRREMIRAVEAAIQRNFGPEVKVTFTGLPLFFESVTRMIVEGQTQSLALAVVAVYFLVYLLTHSWLGSLVCMIPVLLTIVVNFGVMGWAGIPLDVVSVLIASIAMGIGIDYSVHIYARYHEETLAGKTPQEAARATVLTAGEAVVHNALAVFAGFALLLASEFRPVQYFGGLTALTMVVSSLAALVLLPAALVVAGRSRLTNTQKVGG
ncbi:MAG TPA: RND family transporter [Firmicutes bacterium]|nr:RND family transporter [Bacillota bacterium]